MCRGLRAICVGIEKIECLRHQGCGTLKRDQPATFGIPSNHTRPLRHTPADEPGAGLRDNRQLLAAKVRPH